MYIITSDISNLLAHHYFLAVHLKDNCAYFFLTLAGTNDYLRPLASHDSNEYHSSSIFAITYLVARLLCEHSA